MMSGEHITKDDIVDMFAALPEGTRNGILMDLNNAINETEAESEDGSVPSDEAKKSIKCLTTMKDCLIQASNEYKGLSKR